MLSPLSNSTISDSGSFYASRSQAEIHSLSSSTERSTCNRKRKISQTNNDNAKIDDDHKQNEINHNDSKNIPFIGNKAAFVSYLHYNPSDYLMQQAESKLSMLHKQLRWFRSTECHDTQLLLCFEQQVNDVEHLYKHNGCWCVLAIQANSANTDMYKNNNATKQARLDALLAGCREIINDIVNRSLKRLFLLSQYFIPTLLPLYEFINEARRKLVTMKLQFYNDSSFSTNSALLSIAEVTKIQQQLDLIESQMKGSSVRLSSESTNCSTLPGEATLTQLLEKCREIIQEVLNCTESIITKLENQNCL